MQNAMRILARHVKRRMNCETGRVGKIRRLANRVPIHIDFDQTGRRHLVKKHSIRIE